ncbi:acyltransferase [Chryseobacterium sp. Tr-659]|uniref:acyltransferase n=1 Tax=Chryseobacterium sp. Tr-659 TaxID=2608340 RepID=UPI00141E9D77|nr:acyltransferase [Chryseobacterium sp. Tr-659]NIF05501.1 acyltransferase [Chryseobacterium sp. Tr-659]
MFYNFFEKINRKKQLFLLKKHPNVFFENIRLGVGNRFTLDKDVKKVSIGASADFRNYTCILVTKNATLEIGHHVFMNNFCSINCLEHIIIGNNTLFGENVKLYDHNHVYETSPVMKVYPSEFTKAPIKIGNNCWLGSNVTVLKGVTIGDNCIIGAGCTIYKDVPPNTQVINKQELVFNSL